MRVRSPSELPEFQAAIAGEWLDRTVAFHSLIKTVEGFRLVPMTLRHFSALRLAGSPFLPPFQTPSIDDVAQFLWALSPDWRPGRRASLPFLLRTLYFSSRSRKSLAKMAKIVDGLRQFVDVTLADRPPRVVSEGIQEPEFYCDECSMVSAIARDRGWSEDSIMDMPLRKLFQYLKEIREHNALKAGVSPMLCNRSEEISDKYLEEVNKGLR